MTAWMPVSEAAALLGVSERTIWRRIKSESIDSRSENGRTLVRLEHNEETDGPLRHITPLPTGQLHATLPDAEGLSDIVSMVREYRSTLELSARRARRSARLAGVLAVLAVAATAVGGWYYVNDLKRIEREHAQALADLRVRHVNELAEQKAQTERDSVLAVERGRQVEHLQRLTAEQRAELSQVATHREKLTSTIDTRLAEFSKIASADKAMLANRDKEVEQLRDQVESLEDRITRMDDSARRVRDLERKYTEAVRRSASHSRGLVKGLQIHLAYQKEIERQLRSELDMKRDQNTTLAGADRKPGSGKDNDHIELLSALVNQSQDHHPDYMRTEEPVVGWRLIWRHVRETFDPPHDRSDTEIVLVD